MLRILTLGGLSVTRSGESAPVTGVQPRRLAALALIARAGARGITRDRMLALLWPDNDEESGRRALSQALYSLRRDLRADDLFLGVQELRLNPDLAVCDVVEYETALAEGRLEQAAARYEGRFLNGFRVTGVPDFERWLDEERTALEHRQARLLEQLARNASDAGDTAAAVEWRRRQAALDPLNSRIAVDLMLALAAAGDRTGALRHARIYEALMEQELDLPPDNEVIALAERLRNEPVAVAAPIAVPAPPAAQPIAVPAAPPAAGPSTTSAPEPRIAADSAEARAAEAPESPATTSSAASTAAPPPESVPPIAASGTHRTSRRRRVRAGQRRLMWLSAALTAVAVVAVASVLRPAATVASEAEVPVLAVGAIADYTADRSSGAAVADMLATNLARTPGLRVISTPRLYASLPAGGDASALGRAAGAAGAQVLLEGSIYDAGHGRLRLDLRRIDLTTGEVVQAFVLEAADLFAIADSGTARLVASLGLRAPVGGLATVSTTSPLAYRLYEEGLRAYFRNDLPAANRLFEEALGEDSTFAMAAFYALQSHTDRTAGPRDRAVRLAARTSERERLTILAYVASFDAGTDLTALADSLLTLYPHEVEGYLYSGIARMLAARYPEAVRSLERAVEMDSTSVRNNRLPCYGCTALRQLISTHQLSDSLAAAEREARRWVGFRPDLAEAWRTLAETLDLADKGEEARLAIERAAALSPVRDDLWFYEPAHYIRRGDFARADSLLRRVPVRPGTDVELATRELLGYSLRNQGRLREAADLAEWPAFTGRTPHVEPARVLLERGEFRQAAAIFDSIARWPYEDAPPHIASHRVLYTALAASALADAGDFDAVRARIDTIGDLVPLSGLARSRAMLHYLRGLAHVGEGRDGEAIVEFRAAMYSPNLGTPRLNLHLAQALLRQDRAVEAVAVMQAALRGRVQPPTSLVTRTDMHRQLGTAWAAAGRPDSAAWHYERALRSWQNADPEVRARRDSVAVELRRLRR